MICKKCSTAVNDNAKSCAVCGKIVKRSSAGWKCLIALLCIAAITSIYIYGGHYEALFDEEPGSHDEEQHNENPYDDAIAYDDMAVTGVLLPPPEFPADLEMPIFDVWAMLDEVSGFINEYYDYHSQTVLFLSKNGYLFDFPADNYVFIEELHDLTDIDERYLVEGIMFFYFRPADLARFRNLNVSQREDLVIFAGFETREGFAITGRGEQGGTINREDLREILNDYSWDHGEIRIVDSQSHMFETALRALAAYTGNTAGFDIRHMYRDDRYIIIVASPRNDTRDIGMFILEYLEGAAFVRLSHLETFNNHRRVINNAIPNFNQSLLPIYDLSQERRHLIDDFEEILYGMLEAELITEYDLPLLFASGTRNYVYFEFESGLKFLGYLQGERWIMYPVDNFLMARAALYNLSRRPPLFIIRQS